MVATKNRSLNLWGILPLLTVEKGRKILNITPTKMSSVSLSISVSSKKSFLVFHRLSPLDNVSWQLSPAAFSRVVRVMHLYNQCVCVFVCVFMHTVLSSRVRSLSLPDSSSFPWHLPIHVCCSLNICSVAASSILGFQRPRLSSCYADLISVFTDYLYREIVGIPFL